jgi:hypothetical protein
VKQRVWRMNAAVAFGLSAFGLINGLFVRAPGPTFDLAIIGCVAGMAALWNAGRLKRKR